METLKKPETMLGIGNSVAIIVVAVYVYHKLKGITEDQQEQSEKLKKTIAAIPDMTSIVTSQQKLGKLIQDLNAGIQQDSERIIDTLELAYVELENQGNRIDALKQAIEAMGGTVQYPNEVREPSDFPLRPPPVRAPSRSSFRSANSSNAGQRQQRSTGSVKRNVAKGEENDDETRETQGTRRSAQPTVTFEDRDEQEQEVPLRNSSLAGRAAQRRLASRQQQQVDEEDENSLEDEIANVRNRRKVGAN